MLRDRDNIIGLPGLNRRYRRQTDQANNIVSRMAALIMAGYLVGTQYVIENPADRGDSSVPHIYIHAKHGPMWLLSEMLTLVSKYGGKLVTFSMCAFGASWQKHTS